MGICIDFYKYNYDKVVNNLVEKKKIKDKELLEKILAEFGEHIGDKYIITSNEYYEEGICDWNLWTMLNEVFGIEESDDCFYKDSDREEIISYKEIKDAYDNLGLKRKNKE